MRVLRRAKNLKELSQQFDAIKSGVAGDTNFTAAALLWLCEHANGTEPHPARLVRESAFINEMRALRKAIEAFTHQQRALRQEIMAGRKVEATLADRIRLLEDTAELKELAHQLGQKARRLETSESTRKP